MGAFLHTHSRKVFLVEGLNEVTHLQDSSGKDTNLAGTGFAQVQFKEEARFTKLVTLWHWQNWSSKSCEGETREQVH